MKSKMYLESLEFLDEEIEPGLLSELRMDTPEFLHKKVMSEVHNQRKKKLYMNYKFYMPVAAAVLIVALFLNGSKNWINHLYAENPVKNTAVTPQPGQNSTSPTIAFETQIDNSNEGKVIPKDTNKIASTKPADTKSKKVKNRTTSVVKKPSTAVQKNSTANNSTDEKTIAMNTDINGKDIVASNGTDTAAQISEMDSNINIEITANNKSEVINFLNSYGTIIDNGENKIYKLNESYINQFTAILETDAIEGKVINGKIIGDSLVIRLVVNK